MITQQDITKIFSRCYAKAALRDGVDMRNVAALYEGMRDQLDITRPFECWDFAIYPPGFHDDRSLELLILLKETYYNIFYESLITNLKSVYKRDEQEGMRLWGELFALAGVFYKDDLLCILCDERKQWKNNYEISPQHLNFSRLIRESRWVDVYPIYREIAANEQLSNEIRGYASITLTQIVLYHFPENSRAAHHLENAESLLPNHFITRRARAEYLLKNGKAQQARDSFLQVIAEKPGDYYAFNGVGDCFAVDLMLENAESWYKDAMQKNYLQSDSYQRLVNLYADRKWFKEKVMEYPALLKNIEKRQRFQNIDDLTTGRIGSAECYNDATMYQVYRDVGAACYTNGDLKQSESWYEKAGLQQPTFSTSIVDIAYLKISEAKHDEAHALITKALENDKDSFDAYWALAYLYEKQDKKEDALQAYKKCLQLRPDWDDWIHNFMGNLYYHYAEYESAEDHFRKAIKANEHYDIYRQNLADAMQARAGLMVKDEPVSAAEKLYKDGAELANDDIRWNVLGNYYFKIKEWKKAIECYNKSISFKNDNSIYYENRGLAFENMGMLKEAEESYKDALKYDNESGRYMNRLGVFYYTKKDYAQSLLYYQKALERNPDEPVYLDNITMTYEQLGQRDKAEPYYLKLVEKEPGNDKIWNQLGLLYFKRNEFERALPYYQKAIELKNNSAIYFENIGILYRSLKNSKEAIANFKRALELNPKNDITWNDTGVLYFVESEFDQAIEYYNKAIELKPDVSLYYENLGLAFEKKNLPSEAIDSYKKALDINPNNAKILNTTGVLYYNLQDFESAVDYYKKAIELENDNWIYQTNLALALRLMGRKDEAIETYKTAIGLKNDDYLNWNELGVLLSEKNKNDEAIEAYKKSISLQPNDPVLYMNLAFSLNASGKPGEAGKVTENFPVTKEVKLEVQNLMQQYLPSVLTNDATRESNDQLLLV